jgi:hypothetical protein
MFLETTMKPLILISSAFNLHQIAKVAPFLREPEGQWIKIEGVESFALRVPDDPVSIPAVIVPYALTTRHRQTLDLAYIILVQGRDPGSGMVKILPSCANAATAIHVAVIQGYSIAFAAALRKEDVGRLAVNMRNVENNVRLVDEEMDLSEDLDDGKLRIWCC